MMGARAGAARAVALACVAVTAVACATTRGPPPRQGARPHRAIACKAPPSEDFFLIGDDPSDRGLFATAQPTRFVRYDGETLTTLPDCKPEVNASLGAYGCNSFMEAYDDAFDIDDSRLFCAKVPLASNALGAALAEGAHVHVDVDLTAICTSTRTTIHRAQIASIPGCSGATHFVYAYDLGALQVRIDDALVPTEARGDLAACNEASMRRQMPCRVPIHVTLHPLLETGEPPPPIVVDPPISSLPLPVPPAPSGPARLPSAGAELAADPHEACVIALNGYRKAVGLNYALRDFRHEKCADGAAARGGPNACGAKLHSVCTRRGSPKQVAIACADEIFREGAGHARYDTMTTTAHPLVYCGIAANPDGTVTVTHSFGDP